MKVTVGTRSLLWGVHQVLLHPLLVALAWWRLYGWRRVTCPASRLRVSLLDPRLWIVFLVHDWGYWGSPEMDGERGKWHPLAGALIASAVLDRELRATRLVWSRRHRAPLATAFFTGPWGRLTLFHSRSLARRLHHPPSALCAPDKLATALYPRWIYLRLARWSGELAEYMAHADTPAGRMRDLDASSPEAWFDSTAAYLRRIAASILDGQPAGVSAEDETYQANRRAAHSRRRPGRAS